MADAYFNNVALLAPLDGCAPQTQLVPDYSNERRPLSLKGNAGFSTTQARSGGSSLYLDGSGDYLTSSSPNFAFGTTDFTVECWVYLLNGGHGNAWPRLFQLGPNTTAGGLWLVLTNVDNPARLLVQGYTATAAFDLVAAAATLTNNAWHHVALTRSGSTWTLWVDGAAYNSGTNGSYAITQSTLYLGSNQDGGESFCGYLDDLRIAAGVARYSAPFTPPAALEYTANVLTTWGNVVQDDLRGYSPFPLPNPKTIAPDRDGTWRDWYLGGRGRIQGTVKEKSTPTDRPVARRVRLYHQYDGLFIAETWSDPATGTYTFPTVDPTLQYFVIAFDDSGHFRAVVADHLVPEAF